MTDFLSSVIISFVTIFVIMDPFPGIIPFLNLTNKCTDLDKRICATKAVTIAGIIALVFLFIGNGLLSILHITLNDFKVGGGIVLGLLGLETILDISFKKNKKGSGIEDIAVLIATPLLTGPGLVSSLIVLSNENGLASTIVALGLALLLSWVILINSIKLKQIVGDNIIHVAGKIIGMLLLALGISYIKNGLLGI